MIYGRSSGRGCITKPKIMNVLSKESLNTIVERRDSKITAEQCAKLKRSTRQAASADKSFSRLSGVADLIKQLKLYGLNKFACGGRQTEAQLTPAQPNTDSEVWADTFVVLVTSRPANCTGTSEAGMISIKRSLAIATIDRYLGIAIQFAVTVAVSRLLTPSEIGVWAIALAVTGLLLSTREFATDVYLIRGPTLTREQTQAAFTVMLVISLLIFGVLNLSAPWLAHFYGERRLVSVLQVVAIAILLEVVGAPSVALMRRKMAFGNVAIVNIARAATSASVTIGLALLGFGYMSFAWAGLAAALLSSALSIYFMPDPWIYRPRLRGLIEVLTFGTYYGANLLLYRVYETVPVFMLGRTLSLDAVGIFNRSALICQLPGKFLLGGVASVIIPALSEEVRAGNDLKESYLRAVSFITAFQWPAFVVLAVLAHGLVFIVLGAQWVQTVPIIQIMAIAALPSFAADLAFPVLVAVGAMRDLLLRALIIWPISAALVVGASPFGLTVVALSFLVIGPTQAFLSLHLVRRHVVFGWCELWKACWRSAVITAASASGPLAIMIWCDFHARISIALVLVSIAVAAAGWFAGVRYTRHELLREIVVMSKRVQKATLSSRKKLNVLLGARGVGTLRALWRPR
jgi:O-antigen/teichoic acid export membrane protein